jgi:hypothetical protein
LANFEAHYNYIERIIEIQKESIKLEFEREEEKFISKIDSIERKLKNNLKKTANEKEKEYFYWNNETLDNSKLIGKIQRGNTNKETQYQRYRFSYDDNLVIEFLTKTFMKY